MGNDNSKSDEERRQKTRHQGVSRAEVNRLLEQQKREYERKLQELNVRKASASPNKPTHVAREATEANDRNIDQILAQQLQDFVRIAYNNNSPSSSITGNQTPSCTNHTAPSNFGTQRSPNKALAATPTHLPGPSGEGTSTTSLERNRNPYNFTRVELQNRQSPASPQANLYPNLGTDTNFGNFTTNTPKQHNAFRNNGVNRDPDDFVFISNNKNAQG
ncbi:hypothetical protein O0L34_g11833 [Tuta absoluta]|nr:hypothetical protein O0L34_g11833 [Tuta absoluta]